MHAITADNARRAATTIKQFLGKKTINVRQSLLLEALSLAMGYRNTRVMEEDAKNAEKAKDEQTELTIYEEASQAQIVKVDNDRLREFGLINHHGRTPEKDEVCLGISDESDLPFFEKELGNSGMVSFGSW